VPGKELSGKMYLEKKYFQFQMVSITFTLKYPVIQVHVEVHYICAKAVKTPHDRKSEVGQCTHTIKIGA
jgi:hypothetical protein